MKYKYKFKKDIEAVQFKGSTMADLIELNHFLGETPEIIYPENNHAPYFVIKNKRGEMNVVRLFDFVIKESLGNYAVVPCQTFIMLYAVA